MTTLQIIAGICLAILIMILMIAFGITQLIKLAEEDEE